MSDVSSIAKQGKHYTYTLAYEDGRVFYVGKGTHKNRIDAHESEARRGVKSHKCNVIRKIWASGEQVVRKKEAYFSSEQDAHLHEIALIFFLRPYGNLTNLTDGGEGVSGLEFSEQHRKAIGAAHKGKHPTVETRQKIRAAGIGRGKGKVLTAEHRKKISVSAKGKVLSESTKQKMSNSQKGKVLSESTKQKMSNKVFSAEHRKNLREANTGKHHSESVIQKISEAQKGKVISPETRRKISDAMTGRTISPETRRKNGEANKRRAEARSQSTVARQDVSQSVQLFSEEVAS